MTDSDLNHLHPFVKSLLAKHIAQATQHGLITKVIETYRDEATQLVSWQKGRDAQGNIIDSTAIVTNAPPGASYHGVSSNAGMPWSLAYHLAIDVPGPPLLGFGDSRLTKAAEALYTGLGILGEGLGLTWGGRWQLRDWTHFEQHVPGHNLANIKARILSMGDIDSLFVHA